MKMNQNNVFAAVNPSLSYAMLYAQFSQCRPKQSDPRMTNKKALSERDICAKFITPALEQAGWDMQKQVREEVGFTDGLSMSRVI